MNLLFEAQVKTIVKNEETMGVEEMIIQQVREQGIEQKVIEATKKMLRKGSSVFFICEVLEVSPDFVRRIQSKMT